MGGSPLWRGSGPGGRTILVVSGRRDWLRRSEQAEPEERWGLLCFLAGQEVELDAGELNGAIRRAELLLATGGDPRRRLELHGRAVSAIAADLDAPEHRAALRAGLEALRPDAEGLPGMAAALRLLLDDDDLAWQAYALALLAAALGEDADPAPA